MKISYNLRDCMMKYLPMATIEGMRIRYALRANRSPILILQGGKVGSSSIYAGLCKSSLIHPSYHIHFLSQAKISHWEEYFNANNIHYPHHLVVSRILSDLYAGDKIPFTYIVTAVREPIGRRISSFFENYTVTHPELLNYSGQDLAKKAVDILASIFDEEASEIGSYMDSWFHEEIYSNFGLDVFKHPFDPEKGFHEVENDKAKLVLFRIEDLTANFSRGMASLFGEKISLSLSNISTEKTYCDAYKMTKGLLRLKGEIVQEVLSSRLIESFYANEKESLIHRWSI